MIILTIRTDKPEAEIGLYNETEQLQYETWEAHRQLAETIHSKLSQLLDSQAQARSDLGGIVVFQGPGSFTGLRIGISVANALADSLAIPIVATMSDNWVTTGIDKLLHGSNEKIIIPEYGALPHITSPKK